MHVLVYGVAKHRKAPVTIPGNRHNVLKRENNPSVAYAQGYLDYGVRHNHIGTDLLMHHGSLRMIMIDHDYVLSLK